MGRLISIIVGVCLGLLSAFFFFYLARLLYVTRGLTLIRVGGQGAYFGALAFPLFALLCGWGAWRLLRRKQKSDG
jgi:hypothetical protein